MTYDIPFLHILLTIRKTTDVVIWMQYKLSTEFLLFLKIIGLNLHKVMTYPSIIIN